MPRIQMIVFSLTFFLVSFFILFKAASHCYKITSSRTEIPSELLLGAATSAFQVEGASHKNGKSESYIEWTLHKLLKNVSLDIAASDSYHRYKEDVNILNYTKVVKIRSRTLIYFTHSLNDNICDSRQLNLYRFSISWARLLPTGYANFINKDGVRYYNAILDELERVAVEPIVVLHYFDHPVALENLNIWENGKIVDLFTNYSRIVFQEFGGRVRNFVTFNEANELCSQWIPYYVDDGSDEAKRMDRAYKCGHNVLKAHAQVYHMYHKEYNPKGMGQISINFKCEHYFAKNHGDESSTEMAFQFDCGWLAHPIFSQSGDYHNLLKQRVQANSLAENLTVSRLPVFTEKWIEKIRGSADYFGLSYFSSYMVETIPWGYPKSWIKSNFGTSLLSDSRLLVSNTSPCDFSNNKFCDSLEGFKNTLRKIHDQYDNPAIYILANGYGYDDHLNDTKRINYLYSHIKTVVDAIKHDDIDIKAYIYWSLIDCFEYTETHDFRFGLAYVDFDSKNRTRTLRQSATWLRNVGETGLICNVDSREYCTS